MSLTPREKAFLNHRSGGTQPPWGTPKNAPKANLAKGTPVKGPLSINDKLNANANKWLSKDPTTKSGFAKDRTVARSIAGGGKPYFSYKGLPSVDIKDIAKGYFNFRKMLAPWEMALYPGEAMAPSWGDIGDNVVFDQPYDDRVQRLARGPLGGL